MAGVTTRARSIVFIIAGALMLAALILSVTANGGLSELVAEVNRFGYNVTSDDIYLAGDFGKTTVSTLLAEEDTPLDEAVAASVSAGYPSDVDRVGDIALILCHVGGDDVVTLYTVDGDVELGFLQNTETGEVSALCP